MQFLTGLDDTSAFVRIWLCHWFFVLRLVDATRTFQEILILLKQDFVALFLLTYLLSSLGSFLCLSFCRLYSFRRKHNHNRSHNYF
jgi:hypothetical protein